METSWVWIDFCIFLPCSFFRVRAWSSQIMRNDNSSPAIPTWKMIQWSYDSLRGMLCGCIPHIAQVWWPRLAQHPASAPKDTVACGFIFRNRGPKHGNSTPCMLGGVRSQIYQAFLAAGCHWNHSCAGKFRPGWGRVMSVDVPCWTWRKGLE